MYISSNLTLHYKEQEKNKEQHSWKEIEKKYQSKNKMKLKLKIEKINKAKSCLLNKQNLKTFHYTL